MSPTNPDVAEVRGAFESLLRWASNPEADDEVEGARDVFDRLGRARSAREFRRLLREDEALSSSVFRTVLASADGPDEAIRLAASSAAYAARDNPAGETLRARAAVWALRRFTEEGHGAAASPEARTMLVAKLLERATMVHDAVRSLLQANAFGLEEGKPLGLDEAVYGVLERTGEHGREQAKKGRSNSAERVRKAIAGEGTPADLVLQWSPDGDVGAPRYLVVLALSLWVDVVQPALLSAPLRLDGIRVRDGADRYAIVQHVAAETVWAVGGGGLAVAELCGAGELTAPATVPGFAFVPRTAAFLSKLGRPAQGVLALGFDRDGKDPRDGKEPLPVALAKQTGGRDEVLTMVGGKLSLLLLSHKGLRTPGACRFSSLNALAKMVYPNASRIQAREIESVAEALRQLNKLRLYLLGTQGETPVFNIDTIEQDRVVFSIASPFLLRMEGLGRSRAEHNSSFLFNRDGTMRIDNRKPRLLRYYVLSADGWNRDRRDPRNIKPVPVEEMLARANALQPAALAALEAKLGKRKVSQMQSSVLCEARKRIFEDYGELHECKLIKLGASPGKGYVLALPPDDFLEAYNSTPSANKSTDAASLTEAK